MIYLTGTIDQVYCQSFARTVQNGTDDTTSMLFRMKDGMSGYLGTMTTTGPGFSFQVFGSKRLVRLEGLTHVAGASSEERRMRLFGACKFQPVKGEAKVWQAATLDISRAALEAFAKAAEGGPAFPIPYDQMIEGVAATEAISHALVILGLQSVKTLVLGFSLVTNLKSNKNTGFKHLAYWKRSIYAATAARTPSSSLIDGCQPSSARSRSGEPTSQGSSSLRMAITPKPSSDASAFIAAATCSANSRTECARPVATFQVAMPPFSRLCASARNIASTTSSI